MGRIINKFRQARLDYQQRIGRDASIQEVADAIGITRSALSNIERGTSWPGEKVLTQICAFYGLQPGDLLRYEEPRGTSNSTPEGRTP
jgi:transcriptional regulator with XRE-family HTH domain